MGTELDEEQWNVDHASLEATLNMLQKDKQNAQKQTLSSRSRLCVYLGYALVAVPVTIWNAVKLGLYQKNNIYTQHDKLKTSVLLVYNQRINNHQTTNEAHVLRHMMRHETLMQYV